MKICSRCKVEKKDKEFKDNNHKTWYGKEIKKLHPWCNSCRSEVREKYGNKTLVVGNKDYADFIIKNGGWTVSKYNGQVEKDGVETHPACYFDGWSESVETILWFRKKLKRQIKEGLCHKSSDLYYRLFEGDSAKFLDSVLERTIECVIEEPENSWSDNLENIGKNGVDAYVVFEPVKKSRDKVKNRPQITSGRAG